MASGEQLLITTLTFQPDRALKDAHLTRNEFKSPESELDAKRKRRIAHDVIGWRSGGPGWVKKITNDRTEPPAITNIRSDVWDAASVTRAWDISGTASGVIDHAFKGLYIEKRIDRAARFTVPVVDLALVTR